MSFARTLILNQSYRPHEIIDWRDAVIRMVNGKIEVLVQYDEILAHFSAQTLHTYPELRRALRQVIPTDVVGLDVKVPAVAVLRRRVTLVKGGVKFSKPNVCLRDDFSCQYCLAPEHRVLTSDLRWKPLADLRVGDGLVGFDEHRESAGGRRFRPSIVESHELIRVPRFRVLLEDGTVFHATAEHRWLGKTKDAAALTWFTTLQLRGKRLPRLFDQWTAEESREAGWIAGIFDGEGWTTKKGMTLAVAQNPGSVLEHLKHGLRSRGYLFGLERVGPGSECLRVNVLGAAREKARLLGQLRPYRLLESFDPRMLGRVQTDDFVRVASVEPAGVGWVVKMQTSSSTFIADGFPHHNCGTKLPMSQLNYDHVVPRRQGGKTVWENIVVSCYPCNERKGGRTPDEAGMALLSVPVKPKTLPLNEPLIDVSNAPAEWGPFLGRVA